MVDLVRDLPYVQWDPVTTVAPSHLLTLWSRLGRFRVSDLDRLMWQEKRVFEHWTPFAALVLTEDYPLYQSLMRRYPDSMTDSWGRQRNEARLFLVRHAKLRAAMLRQLRRGPLVLGEFTDHRTTHRDLGDWGPTSDVSVMLWHLSMTGDVMVVGHRKNQNLWGLSEDFLPAWTPREEMEEAEFERRAAQRALRGLGVATPREIHTYFPRGRYHDLQGTLAQLEEEGRIQRVNVTDLTDHGERYVHADDIPLLTALQDPGSKEWYPRTTLIPPFDNLLYSQARGRWLFGFDYIREQFLPREKRRYGTYVLPIVRGERLIGRIDPRLEAETGTLTVNAVHAEPDAPTGREVGLEVGETISDLAHFLGAKRVAYGSRVPAAWKRELRATAE